MKPHTSHPRIWYSPGDYQRRPVLSRPCFERGAAPRRGPRISITSLVPPPERPEHHLRAFRFTWQPASVRGGGLVGLIPLPTMKVARPASQDLARPLELPYKHGGGIMGFVTIIKRYPGEKLLVVALSNLENSPIGSIGTDLAAIALGQRFARSPARSRPAGLGHGPRHRGPDPGPQAPGPLRRHDHPLDHRVRPDALEPGGQGPRPQPILLHQLARWRRHQRRNLPRSQRRVWLQAARPQEPDRGLRYPRHHPAPAGNRPHQAHRPPQRH